MYLVLRWCFEKKIVLFGVVQVSNIEEKTHRSVGIRNRAIRYTVYQSNAVPTRLSSKSQYLRYLRILANLIRLVICCSTCSKTRDCNPAYDFQSCGPRAIGSNPACYSVAHFRYNPPPLIYFSSFLFIKSSTYNWSKYNFFTKIENWKWTS